MHCQVCRKKFKEDEGVFLDIYNGLSHKECFPHKFESIKDVGTYADITERYKFFNKMKKRIVN